MHTDPFTGVKCSLESKFGTWTIGKYLKNDNDANITELVGFLDFQETKKTNFESWILGFPRNQLFFSRKLDSWINQETNIEVGLLDFQETNFESWILGFPRNQLSEKKSWIVGFPRNQLFFSEGWILG